MKLLLFVSFGLLLYLTGAKKKKDPKDYTDADIYRLEEEWTEEGEIDEGDLPEHKRPSEPIDFSKVDPSDPEGMLKMTKRHKTLMMFVTISGNPSEAETEEITSLWQSMLYNANIEITRFVISSNRILIRLTDGSYAYEIKDFLIQQDRCELVSIEGKDYPGKGSKAQGGNEKEKPKTKNNKEKSTKSVNKKSEHKKAKDSAKEKLKDKKKGNTNAKDSKYKKTKSKNEKENATGKKKNKKAGKKPTNEEL